MTMDITQAKYKHSVHLFHYQIGQVWKTETMSSS